MPNCYIICGDRTAVIKGDRMDIVGEDLIVYEKDRVKGVFKMDMVDMAYQTEVKQCQN